MFQDEWNRDYFQWIVIDYICAVIAPCLFETSYSFIQSTMQPTIVYATLTKISKMQ